MLTSLPRDNWERLVAAVVKREQIWQLCHQDSVTTVSSNTHSPSNSGSEILSDRSRHISESSPLQPPHTRTSSTSSRVRKSGSGTITQKLFSALLWRRKLKDYDMGDGLVSIPEDHFGLQCFPLRELRVATDNFSKKNVLRQDGHSATYKGRLTDGSLVEVKRLTTKAKEMGNELEISSITSHCNVVSARGFCITERERLLVYPYMANGSAASYLRERKESVPQLDWRVRKWIAIDVAKGLVYLHHECPRKIVHLDVKAANILLDENFRAVVASLNMAEFIDSYDDEVITSIKGTIGHIAPEFLSTGKCSSKADVFGYGIFLLELLLTEKRAFDLARLTNDEEVMLLDWGEWKMVVGADFQSDFVDEEVEELVQIALLCAQTNPELRPMMVEVVRMLEDSFCLNETWEELCTKGIVDSRNVENFTLDTLDAATENFSSKIISNDGFNIVYKGNLAEGFSVAVKRYNSPSLEYYFEKELDIGRVCLHPNLVHTIGFCRTPEEQLLVYRFMVNGSVESWLRGRHESRPPLTWRRRRRIAVGVARGLAYLHDECEKKIVHCDIKASNILLDDNFEAVVSDFKLANIMDCNETHITTVVSGTIGHIAPEYLASGMCSEKSDVFAYGAFLLELITGERTIDHLHIVDDEDMFCVDWVKRNYEERRWELMADRDSGGEFKKAVVKKMVQVAVLCTQYDPDNRPRMSDVVRMLEVGDNRGEGYKERQEKEIIVNVAT